MIPKTVVLTALLSLALLVTACSRKVAETPAVTVDETTVQQPAEPQPPAEQPAPEPAAPQAEEPLSFETVHFDYDKFDLRSDARNILAGHAKKLIANPAAKLVIEGHCDERGTVEYNLALGEKRANAVKAYLVNSGVQGSRLSTISYGKERPVDTRQAEDAWAKNRRAVFVIQ